MDEIKIAAIIEKSVRAGMGVVTSKFEEKIAEISKRIDELPTPEKGDKGDSVSIEDLREAIEQEVKKIEIPEPDISGLEKSVSESISKIPTLESILDSALPKLEAKHSDWIASRERYDNDRVDNYLKNIPIPKDGKDALSLDNFNIELCEDGRTLKLSLDDGEKVVEKSIKLNTILDRGIFADGKTYEKGDGVTYGGNFWIAQKDGVTGRPGVDDGWRLAVKRGRDGSETVKVERKKEPVKLEG